MKTKGMLVVLVIASFLVTGFALEAKAEQITIEIKAQVNDVRYGDENIANEAAIKVGDIITGKYTYDSDTQQSPSDVSYVGSYWYSEPPFGIQISAGPYRFRTDMNDVDFLVQIVNDQPIKHSSAEPYHYEDAYLLRSYNNIVEKKVAHKFRYFTYYTWEPINLEEYVGDDYYGYYENHISWQLDDETGASNIDTSLPTLPPKLYDWTSIFGLTIENPLFFIRATVKSANKVATR